MKPSKPPTNYSPPQTHTYTHIHTQVYLAPATLRPETMYGQTNCFVLPEGDYGAYRWANGDVYIMSARSAKGLSYQVRACARARVCVYEVWI